MIALRRNGSLLENGRRTSCAVLCRKYQKEAWVMGKQVVIIGGSAAGITAGITARRNYPDCEITLIRKEEKVLIPCGIPYISAPSACRRKI